MSSGLREAFRSPYFTVEIDEAEAFAWVRRTAEPFPSLEEMAVAWRQAFRFINDREPGWYAVLMDMREGPSRNDPEFEEAVRRVQHAYVRRFRRLSMLVRTAAGALQARRFTWELGGQFGKVNGVFMDEGEALAYAKARGPGVEG